MKRPTKRPTKRAMSRLSPLVPLGFLPLLLGACASSWGGTPTADPDWEERVLAMLDAWPSEQYVISVGGETVGSMTLRQGLTRESGETLLLLEDSARVLDPTGGGGQLEYSYTARCRLDDHLTPRRIVAEAPGPDGKPVSSQLVVRSGRATGTTFEGAVDLAVPERLLIRQGLMRLVCLLPREVGTETQLAFLSLGAKPRLEPQQSVRCVEHTSLRLDGRDHPAWRFEYRPGKTRQQAVSLWVGDDGRLLRFHDESGLQLTLAEGR
jgi:hypothetical protein